MKPMNDPFSPTPERFHLRVEQTLNGLEETEMTKRKFTVSLAVALAVLLAAAVAGYAAYTDIQESVDWQGRVSHEEVPIEELQPESTPSPAEAALDDVPEGEEWSVLSPNGSVTWHPCLHSVDSLKQFEQMLYGARLPMPNLPEGVKFVQAAIRMPTEEVPYEETVLSGEILQKRRMQPLYAGGALEYRLILQTADGARLDISCEQFPKDQENLSFGLNSGDTYEVVDTRGCGWTHGMYIAHSDGSAFVTMQSTSSEVLIELTVRADSDAVSKQMLLAIVPEL